MSALVLTVDLQVLGQRHKDIKNGLSTPPRMTVPNIINLATKPRWCLAMFGKKRRTFRDIVGHGKGSQTSLAVVLDSGAVDPTLSSDDVKRIKDRCGRKLILKGILDPEDAEMAVASGAEALIVSNHGGRQLDGAVSSVMALPAIASAVGNRIEGPHGWGDPIRAGCHQGPGAWCQGRLHWAGLSVRSRGWRGGWGNAVPRCSPDSLGAYPADRTGVLDRAS